MKPKVVVFSGAGMSAESGIMTFRDMGGLWERYDVTEVASPVAWKNNPQLVMDFYSLRILFRWSYVLCICVSRVF